MQSRLLPSLKDIVSFYFLFQKKIEKENLIPDIAHGSRIGAHEDLDRFFGIIEESIEFPFCRLASSWNLNANVALELKM
jgi:hypothetical protein